MGGYEAPLTLSAFLAGLAVAGRVHGIWMAVGLAVEAEMLYLAGVRLRSRFLRALGWIGFAFSLERLLIVDVLYLDGRSLWFGHEIRNWTPPALFHAALFYLNRRLHGPAAAFSWLAGGLLALVLGVETHQRFLGAAWLLATVGLYEIGRWKKLREYRMQACCLGVMGVGALLWVHLTADWPLPWIPLSLGLAIAYGYALRAAREGEWLTWGAACCTLLLGLLLLDKVVPAGYLGLAWWLAALSWFELGLRKRPEPLRWISYAAAALATVAVVVSHIGEFAKFAPLVVWGSYLGAGAAAWILSLRAELEDAGERAVVRNASSAVGTLFVLAGLWVVAPRAVVPVAWMGLSLLLLVLARRPVLSYFCAGLSFLHVWEANFPSEEMVTAGAVAATLYGAEFLAHRSPRARAFFSALATLLVAGLLWHEVSDRMLTVAWGVEGLLLLAAGFPARERPLRLAGLALLLFCISKLFVYDLRHLETLYRILSFVALGLILLGVSWIYTRFRETIRRGFLQE
ncbi:MAG: DUF2339 domain-containing protein, partial [Acidobacteria bacterium]|nr:DUF2339 domain-containing protein [Acidobacteriota bacterium]